MAVAALAVMRLLNVELTQNVCFVFLSLHVDELLPLHIICCMERDVSTNSANHAHNFILTMLL